MPPLRAARPVRSRKRVSPDAFAALARLSAARAEQEPALPVARDALTATETVTVVSGLLRAADLNVFDLAMWFRRSA